MRHRYIGGALLAAAAVLAGPSAAPAQFSTGTLPTGGGEDGGFQVARNTGPTAPIPTGAAGDSGFYFGAEFVMLMQNRAIGSQVVTRRGFYDLTGQFGKPGALIGSGAEAVNTGDYTDQKWQPGVSVELGYRFDDGTRIFLSYLQLYDAHYTRGASPVPPGYKTQTNLADTFLSTPVFNFNQFFSGPSGKVTGVSDQAVYGIWNAASQVDTKFLQRYQQAQIGARVPMFQTDYSRVYGSGGAQFSWFFERFTWRTLALDQAGNGRPQDTAWYSNTLSQRMYGPFLGCGHEIFIANQFSISADLTGALLLDVAKMRAKYRLGDYSSQSKWGNEEFRIIPNANAAFNLWWYPVEGVQMRVGYQLMTFYGTTYMETPVGMDFGNISPDYGFKAFRLVQGFNVGIGFFF